MKKMKMEIVGVYFLVIMGKVACNPLCLTWQLFDDTIRLDCRVTKLDVMCETAFYNPSEEKIAYCLPLVEKQNRSCFTQNKISTITQNNETNITSLILYGNLNTYNGQWMCTHGKNRALTTVSVSKGIENSLDIYINGTVEVRNNASYVKLSCMSCWENEGNTVYILQNHISIDYVRYSGRSCYHTNGLCKPETCGCLPEHNEYTLVTYFDRDLEHESYTCEMKFMDVKTGRRFQKSRTLLFTPDGNYLEDNISKTNTNMSDDKEPVENQDNITLFIGIGIAVSFVSVVSIIIVVQCIKYRRPKKYVGGFSPKTIEESEMSGIPEKTPLTGELSENIVLEVESQAQPTVEERQVFHPSFLYSTSIPKQRDDPPISIRGLMLLEGKTVAIIDYNNNILTLFNNETFKHIELRSCPRAMTKLSDTQIAISFELEKEIRMYDVHSFEVKQSETIISLDRFGKPFSITYNDEYFAVECGEGSRGCIAVISLKGELETKIEKQNLWYFTGNTIRLALNVQRKEVYVSAISKNAVYSVNFDGKILFEVKINCPRDILMVQRIGLILIVSKNKNEIYAMDCHGTLYRVLGTDSGIHSPKYMSYIWKDKDLVLCVTSNNSSVSMYQLKYEEEL